MPSMFPAGGIGPGPAVRGRVGFRPSLGERRRSKSWWFSGRTALLRRSGGLNTRFADLVHGLLGGLGRHLVDLDVAVQPILDVGLHHFGLPGDQTPDRPDARQLVERPDVPVGGMPAVVHPLCQGLLASPRQSEAALNHALEALRERLHVDRLQGCLPTVLRQPRGAADGGLGPGADHLLGSFFGLAFATLRRLAVAAGTQHMRLTFLAVLLLTLATGTQHMRLTVLAVLLLILAAGMQHMRLT